MILIAHYATRDVSASPCRKLLITSAGVKRTSTISALLSDVELVYAKRVTDPEIDAVLGWGRRPSAIKAAKIASNNGLKLLTVEDGFIRSLGLGGDDPPLSLVVDDLGIFYDATIPSRLEVQIAEDITHQEAERAQKLREAWVRARVSKYNGFRRTHPVYEKPYVLAIDQTKGDASILAGLADAGSFERMLQAALDEHPDALVILKIHPEVVEGNKRGHFDLAALSDHPRVRISSEQVHLPDLVEHAKAVYVVTSQVGFEALLWDKPVRVFGMPFYGGWSLTKDDLPPPTRRKPISLNQLIFGALVKYTRYVDPETMRRSTPEKVIAWLGLQRKMRERFPEKITALGFSKWKEPFLKDFFQGSGVSFVSDSTALAKQVAVGTSLLAVWGRKQDETLAQGHHQSIPTVRIEDGFLRSVGLGAHLTRPLSWVQDPVGIYYDANVPSALEQTLAHYDFDDALRLRAAALRSRILSLGITKYNLSAQRIWDRPLGDRRVILVPGQVESDASIRFGSASIRRNIDMLAAVRTACPESYIVYKPHPDVYANLRDVGEGESRALEFCDVVVNDVSMDALLGSVDEVHTLTSLTGFEALMRGKPVTVYGQPFYAGWRLTQDIGLTTAVRNRRQRVLTLDELVAATLILYPTYVSRVTGRFTSPERALDELVEWRTESPHVPGWRRWLAQIFRKP